MEFEENTSAVSDINSLVSGDNVTEVISLTATTPPPSSDSSVDQTEVADRTDEPTGDASCASRLEGSRCDPETTW